mgnify:CR=1 FL=1|tara:strand:- start:136009 stop:136653 length:645 start_codon:yes stop_codon:yes gene_type:complete
MTEKDMNDSWFSYFHNQATAAPPNGTRVLYPWLHGRAQVEYTITGAQEQGGTTAYNITCTHVPRGDSSASVGTQYSVPLKSLYPIDYHDPAAIAVADQSAPKVALYRVIDGKPFMPLYYKINPTTALEELVLITPNYEYETEVVTIPNEELAERRLATRFVWGTSDGAAIASARAKQSALNAMHAKRIADEVARQQGIAAEWIASIKTVNNHEV